MARRHYHLPGDARTLRGQGFQWVHVFAGKPVPPERDGSFNFLIWDLLREHYPEHLLLTPYRDASLRAVQGHNAAIAYLETRDRITFKSWLRRALTNIPPNPPRQFADEVAACVREAGAPNVLVWGSPSPLRYLRPALPDVTLAFAQRYYEVTRGQPRSFYDDCDYLVVQTEGTARSVFEQEFAVTPAVVHIPNGANLEKYRPVEEETRRALRERFGLPRDKVIAIFPSKLNRHKGTSYLLRWMQEAARRLPELFFLVPGALDAPDQGDTRALTRYLEKAPNARWVQGVASEDMPPLYQASDLALMPGVWREGMSMAAVESLASGLPVVATRRGIYPEIVHHDFNGLLCAPETLLRDGMDAMEALVRDPKLRAELGRNARAYAVKRLSRRRCLDNFRAFFEGRIFDIDADLRP